MKFGTTPIPEQLFDLARERLLGNATSTPDEVRQHLLKHGGLWLQRTNPLPANHAIIASRVLDAVRRELVAKGQIKQFKRGLWATTKFMDAAES
ncbi:hypothetical protein WDL1P1_00418 (plasmid) [Variovorax sp. WDL1]|uniref:hypothetical protein n=1 Tax=Variovorax sp. WDL1 TaxID=207745 RepID=UPI0008394B0C|nr:hypothetical protein [Variovorax sp. WDL1]PNG50367.1 hypothetical protein CHC06_05990 [Variovorax sp. B2]PNG51240.1 hypothetical protein CHC07_05896 [Variovorax sp. B4]VTV17480.1 hypothetical protein WDL1P1_00418 [Variovorax sp. WDL1]